MTEAQPYPRLKSLLIMLAGACLIAIGAQISVPMVPVPTTLQTFVVVLLGLWLGPRRAAGAAALFLFLALLDLPVLSSAQRYGGWEFLTLNTAGYVIGFIPGAAIAGWLGYQKAPWRGLLAGLASHAVILACGVPVLAMWIGLPDAINYGLTPFLAGALAKSIAAVLVVMLINALKQRFSKGISKQD